MRRTSLLTKEYILSRQNVSKRATKQIWHGELLIFSVVVMVTSGLDACLHVWLRSCNSMGKIRLIFPCVFGPCFYFSLVQSLRCFWPSLLRPTSEISFHLFMFFPSQPHPPRTPQKQKKITWCQRALPRLHWWSIFDRAIFRGFRFRLGPLDYKLPTLGGILFFLFHSSTTTLLLNTSI